MSRILLEILVSPLPSAVTQLPHSTHRLSVTWPQPRASPPPGSFTYTDLPGLGHSHPGLCTCLEQSVHPTLSWIKAVCAHDSWGVSFSEIPQPCHFPSRVRGSSSPWALHSQVTALRLLPKRCLGARISHWNMYSVRLTAFHSKASSIEQGRKRISLPLKLQTS